MREEQAKWAARLLLRKWPGGWRNLALAWEDEQNSFDAGIEALDLEAAITGFARQARALSPEQREEAVSFLDDLDYRRPIPVFLRLLSDPAVRVRRAAAVALADRQLAGWPARSLVRALEDEDSMVRGRVARALGKTGDPKGERALLNCLGDSAPSVRASAAKALGDLGGGGTAKAISALLEEDENPLVRRAAWSALSMIGGDWSRRALREYRRATGPQPTGMTAYS